MFCDASLEYVFKIQEVQEKKKFEFVEPVRMGKKNNFFLSCKLAEQQISMEIHFNQIDTNLWPHLKVV